MAHTVAWLEKSWARPWRQDVASITPTLRRLDLGAVAALIHVSDTTRSPFQRPRSSTSWPIFAMSRRNRRGSFGLSSLMPTVVTTPSRRQPIWAVRAVRSSRCIMSNMARKRRDVESGAHTPPSALGRRSPRLPVVELSRDGMVSCTICRWSTPCHATSPISRSHFDNGDAKGTESLLTLRWREKDSNPRSPCLRDCD